MNIQSTQIGGKGTMRRKKKEPDIIFKKESQKKILITKIKLLESIII